MARLTIHGAARMPITRRLAIADWLRAQAQELTSDGPNYSGRFTARYYS